MKEPCPDSLPLTTSPSSPHVLPDLEPRDPPTGAEVNFQRVLAVCAVLLLPTTP